MPEFLPRIALVLALGTISGCGTTMNMHGLFGEITPPRYPFGGTMIDVTHALQPGGGYDGMGYALAMDIPFSIVGDIAMLPITVPYTLLTWEGVDPHFQVEKLEPTQQNEEP